MQEPADLTNPTASLFPRSDLRAHCTSILLYGKFESLFHLLRNSLTVVKDWRVHHRLDALGHKNFSSHGLWLTEFDTGLLFMCCLR